MKQMKLAVTVVSFITTRVYFYLQSEGNHAAVLSICVLCVKRVRRPHQ